MTVSCQHRIRDFLWLRIYHHFFGHRGFFHSPFFGLLLSLFIISLFFRDFDIFSVRWFFSFIFLFILAASHGIFDAFTNGGLGIALLSPFDNTRLFPRGGRLWPPQLVLKRFSVNGAWSSLRVNSNGYGFYPSCWLFFQP